MPLPVYQMQPENNGYLLPLGDSGIVLSTSKNSLAAMINKDAPASWSVTMKMLDQWRNFADYNALPPPEQLLEIIQSEKPLSVTDTDGKGRINLNDEAFKNQ